MSDFGPIGREVYERTYQRRSDAGWAETVDRVIAGNLALVPERFVEAGEAEALRELLLTFKALPAGRHLWASGASDTTLGIFNCHRAGWSELLSDHFAFTFDQLMLGGGVGANYSADPYLNNTPAVVNEVTLQLNVRLGHEDYDECEPWLSPWSVGPVHVVEDSREGWVAALKLVIDSHFTGWAVPLAITFSDVRPRGSIIAGFGGTASGPAPLAAMLTEVNYLLNAAQGRRITPLDAMAIDHAVAGCVVAGNVRRSARMSILHWADPSIFEFIDCKSDPSAHWSTNISVEIDDEFLAAYAAGDEHAVAVMNRTVEGIYRNGEPGFYNSALASVGETGDVRATNPCGEIALEEWEQCLLGHVNLSAFALDHGAAIEAFRLMTRYLVRATHAASSDSRQEAIKAVNRRIGVGFFGFHDWAVLRGVRFEDIADDVVLVNRLRDYRLAVDFAAGVYAAELGIPAPIKTTTVAPTGSIAKLPGVSEGIQPPYARYFVRRVRYSASDPKLLELTQPQEPCVYTDNTTVVSFTARDQIIDKVPAHLVQQSDEVSIRGYLAVQAMVQDVFADNAVSVTANFDRGDTSPTELAALMAEYLPRVKGWTGFPEDGRPQSPYERLSEAEYLAADIVSVSQAMDDCATGACPVR